MTLLRSYHFYEEGGRLFVGGPYFFGYSTRGLEFLDVQDWRQNSRTPYQSGCIGISNTKGVWKL